VRAVQRHLRAAGVDPGRVDGRYGPVTEAAVRRFQSAHGLAVDGIVGARTMPVVRAPVPLARGAGTGLSGGLRRVRALQQHLRTLKVDPGPVDGRYGPRTEAAVRRFQHAHGLVIDGIVGSHTARRLEREQDKAAARPGHRPAQPPRNTAPAERPPTATTPRPAHRPAPVVATAARKPGGSPDGLDPVQIAAVIAVIAAAGVLLVAGWRRRHARHVRPSSEVVPAIAAWPAAQPVDRPDPAPRTRAANGARAREPEDRPAGRRPAAPAAAPSSPAPPGSARIRALGYVSVPPDVELAAGAGPQAQAIEAACAARGWSFVGGVREPEPHNGKGLGRHGLTHALERLRRGEVDCLMVTELARLTRSAAELGEILDRLERAALRLVVLDVGIDTATDGGRVAARALATVGGWERERLAERTRKGLAAARARGTTGRPAVSDRPELVEQITAMRASGMTLQAIADTLNAQGQPTVRGGARWRPSSVQSALGYKRRPRAANTNTKANGRDHRRND
jgi:peptidoglycan hydrolase-like protein with peptidoglycan-binding domain/DNA invertase Pin-like site-specific DNA recombinase